MLETLMELRLEEDSVELFQDLQEMPEEKKEVEL